MPFPKQSLSDSEIINLYRKVVMYYEQGKERNYRVKAKCLQQFLKEKKIQLEIGTAKGSRPSESEFLSRRETGFWFIDSKGNQVHSLFSHLRNSVAHCTVTCEKINNRWYFCFRDNNRGRLTMLGKIPKKLLTGFIEVLALSEITVNK